MRRTSGNKETKNKPTHMKNKIAFLLTLILITGKGFSQVGIGTTNPHQSAILELSSTEQGLLIPRVGTDKRLGMTPVNGLILYDTDMKQFYVYENDAWSPVVGGGGDGAWIRNGSTSVTSLFNPSDRVGIGLTNPAEQLQITYSFRMPMSSAAAGNIYKDGNLFLHNYGTNNTFLGVLSGNLSLTGSHNSGMGYKTLYQNTSGIRNTALGSGALYANTIGNSSVAIGYNALQSQNGNGTDPAMANTAIGCEALMSSNPTTGADGRYNTALGYRAGGMVTTGHSNVLIGYQAGYYGTGLQTGESNVIIGFNAGVDDNGRYNVVVIGAGAQANGKNQVRLGNTSIDEFFCTGAYNSTSTGSPNMVVNSAGQIMRSTAALPAGSGAANKVAFWTDAGTLAYNNNLHWDNVNQRLGVGASAPNTKLTVGNGTYATFAIEAPAGLTGTKNILAGIGSGRSLTTGANNSLYGHNAGYSLTTGTSNIAVGKEALYTANTAAVNIAVGDSALFSTTSGGKNLALGTEAMFANTTGGNNIAIGTRALRGNTTKSGLIAIGDSALYTNGSGDRNLAIGSNALYATTTGYMNVGVGDQALESNSTGYLNTAVGSEALETSTSGIGNTAYGARTLEETTTGSYNTAIGMESMNSNTTGTSNVAIGAGSMDRNTTGSRSVAIGDSALLSNTSGRGNVAIGYKAGYHETSGDRFYVDNQYRGTEADGREHALLYGKFAEEPEDQQLNVNGKVAIGTTSPAYSAALHISSTDKGVIIPRLTTTQRNAVVNPAEGLMIYNTTLDRFEYYDGSAWKIMISTNSDSGSGAEGSGYCSEGVTDYDGHQYNTVKIGDRCWMAENLKSTHYSTGTSITGCYIYEDTDGNQYRWGRLYTWAAVMNGASSSNTIPSGVQGVCPSGWHMPSDEEWKEAEMTIGMSRASADQQFWRGLFEGKKMRATGEALVWNEASGAIEGNNYSGFTALPAGVRGVDGIYTGVMEKALFWSCTQEDILYAWNRMLTFDHSDVHRTIANKTIGYSVRCVKDF